MAAPPALLKPGFSFLLPEAIISVLLSLAPGVSPASSCSRIITLEREMRYPQFEQLEAHYHPFLFMLIALSAMAELGLTSFLISAGNENGTWPSPRYHSLLILYCFNAAWTTLFSTTYLVWYFDTYSSHVLANVASSVVWLVVTCALWGTASGIMFHTRTGGDCARRATISRCRQSLTVEALGWTEFALCTLMMIATCSWVYSSRWKRRISRFAHQDV